jgi:hypothetical protein
MAVTSHVFPSFQLAMASKLVNVTSDTLKCQLIGAGNHLGTSLNATSEGFTTLASAMAGDGGGALTEVSGTGYTTGGATLSSVTCTDSGLVTTISCANITWTAASFTAYQAIFYDSSVTTPANQVICYWDFGGAQTVTSQNFTLTISGSGLVTLTTS